jgi:hypothetical protein
LTAANAAEWDFRVPTAGTYELFAEYAAALSRPVVISFNGAVKFNSALSAVTGGWFPADRQVISQGTVQLAAGATTMRVARGDVFPHIKGFQLRLLATPSTLSLMESDPAGWLLKMSLQRTNVSGQVGTFEFARFTCGGTLRYLGKSGTGEFVFQESMDHGSCVPGCNIAVAADLTRYRELCTPVPFPNADQWRGFLPVSFSPSELELLLVQLAI